MMSVTLTGTYHLPDGSPASGHVEIIPSERLIVDDAGDVILSGRVKVKLDTAGHFGVDLPATDDPTLNPTGFGYTAAARLHHAHLPAVSFQLPAAVGTVDVTDVTVVDPSTFTPGVTYVSDDELADVEARVTTLEETPAVSSWDDLTDKPTIPATADDVGALPASEVVPDGNLPNRLSAAGLAATTVAPLGKAGAGPNAPLTYFNVKDYGAKGDGTTNDTTAVQAAMDAATTAGGGEVAFPRGTYMVNGLTVNGDNLTLRGVGRTASIIKTRTASTAGKLVDASWRKHLTVTDLGFDGSSHATTLSGIYNAAAGFDKYLTVTRCRFANFMPSNTSNTQGAIYAWHASEVTVTDCEFVDCGRAINLDDPTRCTVIGNHITSPGNVMATGILVRAGAMVQGKVTIASNYVHGAKHDPSGFGTEGHAIAVLQARDTKIIGNTCLSSGRGVLISTNAFGAVVEGNVCNGNTDAGIRIEPSIDASTTVGSNAPRGCTVVGNVTHNNLAQGITISYAAASTVANNLTHDNGADGIAIDSDRVLCIGNTCYNNWKTMAPGGEGGTKAGIRNYQGTGVIMVGNTCFDNQTVKTQLYGISIGDRSPVIFANNLSGNGTADIDFPEYIKAGFYGKAPIAKPAAVPVTAAGVHAALVSLGLISA